MINRKSKRNKARWWMSWDRFNDYDRKPDGHFLYTGFQPVQTVWFASEPMVHQEFLPMLWSSSLFDWNGHISLHLRVNTSKNSIHSFNNAGFCWHSVINISRYVIDSLFLISKFPLVSVDFESISLSFDKCAYTL